MVCSQCYCTVSPRSLDDISVGHLQHLAALISDDSSRYREGQREEGIEDVEETRNVRLCEIVRERRG